MRRINIGEGIREKDSFLKLQAEREKEGEY